MLRKCSVLLASTLLALVMGLGGCQKELQLPSYDIKIERQEEKRNNVEPQTQEHPSTAQAATPSN